MGFPLAHNPQVQPASGLRLMRLQRVCGHLRRWQMQVFEDVPAALDWLTAGDAAAVQRLRAEWNNDVEPAGQG
ncbi:hypothetical protein [Hymenobacter daeguensis]